MIHWQQTQVKNVWLSYHNNKVYMLRSFEPPASLLRAKETKYRDLV